MLTGRGARDTTWRILDAFIDEHASDAGRHDEARGSAPGRRPPARDGVAGARQHGAQRSGRARHRLQPQPPVLLGQLTGPGGSQAWRRLTPGGAEPPVPPRPRDRPSWRWRWARWRAAGPPTPSSRPRRRCLRSGGAGHVRRRGTETPTFTSYTALGDSYTAAPFVPSTDLAEGCLRSNGNYPALLAEELGIERCATSAAARLRPATSRGPSGWPAARAPWPAAAARRRPRHRPGHRRPRWQRRGPVRDAGRVRGRLRPDRARRDRDADTRWRACARTSAPPPRRSPAPATGSTALEAVAAQAPGAEVVLVGYPRLLGDAGGCRRLPDRRERRTGGAAAGEGAA